MLARKFKLLHVLILSVSQSIVYCNKEINLTVYISLWKALWVHMSFLALTVTTVVVDVVAVVVVVVRLFSSA